MYGVKEVHDEVISELVRDGATVEHEELAPAGTPTSVITWTNHDGRVFEIWIQTEEKEG